MSKVIFFTDLHHGGNIIAPPPQDLSIWGHDWGLPLLKAMINYGRKTPNTTMVHGGDEVTFLHADTLIKREKRHFSRRDATQRYIKNAHQTKNLMLSARLPFARVLGNHDPIRNIDEMGFNRFSHVFSRSALPHTDIVICQPVVHRGERVQFEYDVDHIIATIDETTNPNLIISSHWAFDREEIGISGQNGYSYKDNTADIRNYLETKLKHGKLHSVVSLHGHSHRFRLGQSGPIDMLTMPSIVQNDRQFPEFPCGLFAEIEETPETGELTIAYKKMMLQDSDGEKHVVQDVTKDVISKYQRGRKPQGSSMRHMR